MSPIIGTILVLAISVVGIVGVSQWALPAIQEMKVSSDATGVLSEFRNLDAAMHRLIAGTAAESSFKWQPNIRTGTVAVESGANRWLATADTTIATAINWTGVGDLINPDANFSLVSNFTVTSPTIKAWSWSQGSKTELKVCSNPVENTCSAVGDLTAGAASVLYLRTNATTPKNVTIDNAVMSFTVANSAGTVIHQAYLVDVGEVHWDSLIGPRGPRHVFSSNAGVATGPIDALVLESAVALPPPRNFTNSTGSDALSVFVRLVKLNGTASFSPASDGQQRFSLFLNLVGTWEMGTATNITRTSAYVWGPMRDAVYAGLTDAVDGYLYTQVTDTVTNEVLLRFTESKSRQVQFSAMYSLLRVEG